MGDRHHNGQFAAGNPGGPGRPRRAVEREYMAVIGDTVTPDDWKRIVQRARDDALAGDAKARDWLAKFLLGEKPPTLLSLAAAEESGFSVDQEVADQVEADQSSRKLQAMCRMAL